MEENAEIGDVTLVVYGSHATVLVIKSYFWWPKQLYSYEELVKLSFDTLRRCRGWKMEGNVPKRKKWGVASHHLRLLRNHLLINKSFFWAKATV